MDRIRRNPYLQECLTMGRPTEEIQVITALMSQIEGLRGEVKTQAEQTRTEIRLHKDSTDSEFKDIRGDLGDVKERLAEGSEKLRTLRRDVDANAATCKACTTTALERKHHPRPATDTDITTKKRMAWWMPILIGGALTWVGERGIQVVINSLASPPPAASASKAP